MGNRVDGKLGFQGRLTKYVVCVDSGFSRFVQFICKHIEHPNSSLALITSIINVVKNDVYIEGRVNLQFTIAVCVDMSMCNSIKVFAQLGSVDEIPVMGKLQHPN